MPDPCTSCGATLRYDAYEKCQVCGAPVQRLTTEQRAHLRRGPKLAAAATLGVLGALFILGGVVSFAGSGSSEYGYRPGYRYRRVRFPVILFAFGIACLGGAGATLRD